MQRCVIEIFVLMPQTNIVPQFLAGNALPPVVIVVKDLSEIGVIQFGVTGSNVPIRINRDSRDSEPSVLAIGEITYPNLTRATFTLTSLLFVCASVRVFHHFEL